MVKVKKYKKVACPRCNSISILKRVNYPHGREQRPTITYKCRWCGKQW